jgi:hypothetical protein
VTLLKDLRRDPWALRLFLAGTAYAWFLTQGVPLWDDDFTSWLWKTREHSLFRYLWEWISPISTQPQYWGFNERPAQSVFYKLCSMISGYESWSYFFLKSCAYGAMGTVLYAWGLRLAPATRNGRIAALAAAVFLLLAPGTFGAHLLLADFAPVAEFWFLAVTYVIWDEVEKTPVAWVGMPRWREPQFKAWARRWAWLSLVVYLGYKTKADLKLIPGILALYVLAVRRQQWRYFALPVGLMAFLAVPWGCLGGQGFSRSCRRFCRARRGVRSAGCFSLRASARLQRFSGRNRPGTW